MVRAWKTSKNVEIAIIKQNGLVAKSVGNKKRKGGIGHYLISG